MSATKEPCKTCGNVHDWCKAHKKRTDPPVPCSARPETGSDVCRVHGGATKAARAVAAVNRAEAQAVALAHTLVTPLDVDPREAILAQIASRAGQCAWWRQCVAELAPGQSPDVLIRGTLKVSRTVQDATGGQNIGHTESTTTDVGPLVHKALEKWEQAQDALERLCIQAVKIGLDERRIKLAEAQQSMLAEGFRWLVGEARLRLELSEREASVLLDLVGEMMQRLDRIESGARV